MHFKTRKNINILAPIENPLLKVLPESLATSPTKAYRNLNFGMVSPSRFRKNLKTHLGDAMVMGPNGWTLFGFSSYQEARAFLHPDSDTDLGWKKITHALFELTKKGLNFENLCGIPSSTGPFIPLPIEYRELGQSYRWALALRQMTRSEFSRRARINYSNVWHYCGGNNPPRLESLCATLNTLQLSLEEFCSMSEKGHGQALLEYVLKERESIRPEDF